jgi:ABC-type sugar transport system substrate-binding protein
MPSDGHSNLNRRTFLARGVVVTAALATALTVVTAQAQSPSADLAPYGGANTNTNYSQYAPFVPSDTIGTVPDLPKKLVFAVPGPQISEYYQDLSDAAQAGAEANGLEYQLLISKDPADNIDQLRQAMEVGVGAIYLDPQDTAAQAPVVVDAINKGIAVIRHASAPGTLVGTATQYDIAYQQALGAAKYITDELGGQATVVNFTLDFKEILIPRHQGTLDGLATAGPGVTVIDQELGAEPTTDQGATLAATLLQAHPEINVWIGPDDTILGVNAYLESLGKTPETDPGIYLSALNGTAAGKDALKRGTFIKSLWGFNSSLVGYSAGSFAGWWLNGKSIPQLMQTRPGEMSSAEDVDAFDNLSANLPEAFEKALAGEQDTLRYLGNINYDTKDQFVQVDPVEP